MTATEALLIIASLIALEGLLFADNAMVLAVMVKPLRAEQSMSRAWHARSPPAEEVRRLARRVCLPPGGTRAWSVEPQ